MKKIKLLLLALFGYTIFFSSSTFAIVNNQDLETGKENISIITNVFSKDLLINFVFAVVVIIFTFFLSRVLTSKFTSYIEKTAAGDGKGKEELIGVINRTINILVLSIGVLITLGILGIDTSILMGGIGFGLGFALKTFLTNFISGILMVTQGYYHNGDLIKIGEKIGKIKSINSLFTSVQQFDGIIFYIPNIKFMEEEVSNYNANNKRRVDIDLGVDYDTDLLKTKEILLKVLDNFPNILKAPNPKIWVTNFSNSSIDMGIRFWISSDDSFFEIKSHVTETINTAFKKYGIVIPFPQVTISNREDTFKK